MARLAARWGVMIILFGLAACVPQAPPYLAERLATLHPPAPGATIYIRPFQPLLAPPAIEAAIFDRFVDQFNRLASEQQMVGVILKREPTEADQVWLRGQYHMSGEIFAYHEDSGCCSTEFSLQARLTLFQPGESEAAVTVVVPYETFFEHDRMTLEEAQAEMVVAVADRLRDGLWQEISPK